jgi:endogenous inhibitor of DNA gyrase (YacG/DUF329 family)
LLEIRSANSNHFPGGTGGGGTCDARATASALDDYMDDMNQRADIPRFSACPICGKATADKYRPFCGKRCADVDLSRWLNGAYVIPGKEQEDEDGVPRPKDEPPS